jgi:glycosyltransferase involved in cell wall biosynthesis
VSPLTYDGAGRNPVGQGDVVVVIPVHGAHTRFVECLQSVLAHTPLEVPILVTDDASPDERSVKLLAELDESGVLRHRVQLVRHEQNRGFVRTVNEAFELCNPADVVVLNSDCVVTAGWLGAMTAAGSGPLVATVSVLTNNGTILSLPDRNCPAANLPQTLDVDVAARAIESQSLRIRPRIPTAIGHCFLVKRDALDLVGAFDEDFSPGYGEEVDFSQRCVQRGLVNVLADEAFVLHRGSASFDPKTRGSQLRAAHDRKIAARYDYYDEWIYEFSRSRSGPFTRALSAAARSLRSLSVTIDARCLGPIVTGTQIHALEVIAALSGQPDINVRAVVPDEPGGYARAVISSLGTVELVPAHAIGESSPLTDVVHRPSQVSSGDELHALRAMGERVVITHQDLISYHNPSYFPSFDDWEAWRQLTRLALAYADRVVFFSHSAANQAITEDLVQPDSADVVYIGTDHMLDTLPVAERPPRGVEALAGRPFVLCLGTDFAHKNREFALRLLGSLRREHGFEGGLVLAGPHVPIGSSSAAEAEFLAKHPELREFVVDVAAVDEGEKRWLMRNATLMLYPSVHEGFGLVPFEAAELGLACAFASGTSIAELLPSKLALIESWDPDAAAARLAPYLESAELRSEQVAAVRAAAARFTWATTARQLVDVYRAAVAQPASGSRALVEECLSQKRARERDRERFEELRDHYFDLRGQYDKTAQALVGPAGVIPPDLRRPLLAVGSRPALRRTTFGLIRVAYSGGYRIRHAGRGPKG